jgi:hypothetical protein
MIRVAHHRTRSACVRRAGGRRGGRRRRAPGLSWRRTMPGPEPHGSGPVAELARGTSGRRRALGEPGRRGPRAGSVWSGAGGSFRVIPVARVVGTPARASSGHGSDPSGHGSDPSGHGSDPSGHGSDPSGHASDPSGHASDPSGHASDPSGHASDPSSLDRGRGPGSDSEWVGGADSAQRSRRARAAARSPCRVSAARRVNRSHPSQWESARRDSARRDAIISRPCGAPLRRARAGVWVSLAGACKQSPSETRVGMPPCAGPVQAAAADTRRICSCAAGGGGGSARMNSDGSDPDGLRVGRIHETRIRLG